MLCKPPSGAVASFKRAGKAPYWGVCVSERSIVDCDQCGKRFVPNVDEAPLANGGIRQSLNCPSCGAHYPIVAISQTGVRLRAQLGHMRHTGQTASPEYANVLRRYQRQVRRLATTATATNGAAPATATPARPKGQRD